MSRDNQNVIAVYIRLSSEDNDIQGSKTESNSVTTQRDLIYAYIRQRDFEFAGYEIKEFVDDGYSGTNFNRPSFIRMMEEAKQGKIAVIIVKDFSRLGRDYLEVGNYLEKIFPILQIRAIAVNNGYDSADHAGMTGGMGMALHNVVNAMYSRDLSVKVKSAYKTRIEAGQYVGAQAPFGYIKDPADKHHLIIDEEAAKIVRYVFELVASGERKSLIAARLNEENVLTPSEYMIGRGQWTKIPTMIEDKQLWKMTTINRLIKNEVYIGNIVWNKRRLKSVGSKRSVLNPEDKWLRAEGTHEAIVTKELFEKANGEIAKKRSSYYHPSSKKNIVYKGLFFCPYCKRSMRKSSDGTYKCRFASTSGVEGCKTLQADIEELHEAVVLLVRKMSELVDSEAGDRKDVLAGCVSGSALSGNGFEGVGIDWSLHGVAYNMVSDSMKELLGGEVSSSVGKALAGSNIKEIEKAISSVKGLIEKAKADKLNLYTKYRTEDMPKEEYKKQYEKLNKEIESMEATNEQLKQHKETIETRQKEHDERKNLLDKAVETEDFNQEKILKVIERVFVYSEKKIKVIWRFDDYDTNGTLDVKDTTTKEGTTGE